MQKLRLGFLLKLTLASNLSIDDVVADQARKQRQLVDGETQVPRKGLPVVVGCLKGVYVQKLAGQVVRRRVKDHVVRVLGQDAKALVAHGVLGHFHVALVHRRVRLAVAFVLYDEPARVPDKKNAEPLIRVLIISG